MMTNVRAAKNVKRYTKEKALAKKLGIVAAFAGVALFAKTEPGQEVTRAAGEVVEFFRDRPIKNSYCVVPLYQAEGEVVLMLGRPYETPVKRVSIERAALLEKEGNFIALSDLDDRIATDMAASRESIQEAVYTAWSVWRNLVEADDRYVMPEWTTPYLISEIKDDQAFLDEAGHHIDTALNNLHCINIENKDFFSETGYDYNPDYAVLKDAMRKVDTINAMMNVSAEIEKSRRDDRLSARVQNHYTP